MDISKGLDISSITNKENIIKIAKKLIDIIDELQYYLVYYYNDVFNDQEVKVNIPEEHKYKFLYLEDCKEYLKQDNIRYYIALLYGVSLKYGFTISSLCEPIIKKDYNINLNDDNIIIGKPIPRYIGEVMIDDEIGSQYIEFDNDETVLLKTNKLIINTNILINPKEFPLKFKMSQKAKKYFCGIRHKKYLSSAKSIIKKFLVLSKKSSYKSRKIGLIMWDLCKNPVINKNYKKSKAIEYIMDKGYFCNKQNPENIMRELHRAYDITVKSIKNETIMTINDKKKQS